MKFRVMAVALAGLGLLWTAPAAFAAGPIGAGPWTSDSPTFQVQTCVGGQVSGSTFTLPGGSSAMDACSNNKPRAERRYENYAGDGQNYSTGVRQFAGTFTITSMSGTRISLKQTFNGDAGPYFMMAVDNTGRLYSVEGGTTIASGVAKVGTAVQVNTVHDTSAHDFKVYINGSLAYEDKSAPSGEFYDKIGAYETSSGSGQISVNWDGVGFWHK